MKPLKQPVWVMMSLLGLFLMSPHEMQSKYGRHIASDAPQSAEEVKPSETPKLDAIIASSTIPERQNPVNHNEFLVRDELRELLERVEKAEKIENPNREQLNHLRSEITASAIQLRQVEDSLKDLIRPETSEEVKPEISEARIKLEASILDLEASEAKLAEAPAQSETPPVSRERAPSVVAEETRTEATESEASNNDKEKDPLLCAMEEQNKFLKEQLSQFMQQQNLIIQHLISFTQMMMTQNMYRTPETFNYNQAYQYHQPMSQGNWVYYPNGFNPTQMQQPQPQQQPQQQQPNFFGVQPYGTQQPQMNPGQLQQPSMMNQNGQWGLGTMSGFGPDALSFNFSTPSIPTAMGMGTA